MMWRRFVGSLRLRGGAMLSRSSMGVHCGSPGRVTRGRTHGPLEGAVTLDAPADNRTEGEISNRLHEDDRKLRIAGAKPHPASDSSGCYRVQGGVGGCAGKGRSNRPDRGRSDGVGDRGRWFASASRLNRTTSPPITSQSRKFFRADFGWWLWQSTQDRTKARSAETALN
jgi:hypothetical protein